MDFHQHVLQDLNVRYNSHDGVGVIFCNQYAISNPEARLFKNSAFYKNKRHGISFKQLGANITGTSYEFTYIFLNIFITLTYFNHLVN